MLQYIRNSTVLVIICTFTNKKFTIFLFRKFKTNPQENVNWENLMYSQHKPIVNLNKTCTILLHYYCTTNVYLYTTEIDRE